MVGGLVSGKVIPSPIKNKNGFSKAGDATKGQVGFVAINILDIVGIIITTTVAVSALVIIAVDVAVVGIGVMVVVLPTRSPNRSMRDETKPLGRM